MSSQIKGPKMAPRRPKASNLGPTWGPRGVLNGVKKVLKSGLKLQSLLEPQLDPNLTPNKPPNGRQNGPQTSIQSDTKRNLKASRFSRFHHSVSFSSLVIFHCLLIFLLAFLPSSLLTCLLTLPRTPSLTYPFSSLLTY